MASEATLWCPHTAAPPSWTPRYGPPLSTPAVAHTVPTCGRRAAASPALCCCKASACPLRRTHSAAADRPHGSATVLAGTDAVGVNGQGRGGSTGYDNAVALPARSDSEELAKENNKSVAALKGQAVFSVAKVRCAPTHLTAQRKSHVVRTVATLRRCSHRAICTLICGALCQALVPSCIPSLHWCQACLRNGTVQEVSHNKDIAGLSACLCCELTWNLRCAD